MLFVAGTYNPFKYCFKTVLNSKKKSSSAHADTPVKQKRYMFGICLHVPREQIYNPLL